MKRYRWLAALFLVFTVSVVFTACKAETPRHHATVKLLVTRVVSGCNNSDAMGESDASFYDTQEQILRSSILLKRAQTQLKKSREDVVRDLANLEVKRLGKTDLIGVTVTSPSEEFASAFVTALVEEFLKYRSEVRKIGMESGLMGLVRETERLSRELKVANEKIIAYAKEYRIKPEAETPELQNLRDDRERIRALYNALLAQLMKVDVQINFRQITILEPAVTGPVEKP